MTDDTAVATMQDGGISETLGTDICTGLKNAKGEELGNFQVPRLGAFRVFELEPKIVAQFNKVQEVQRKSKSGTMPKEEWEKYVTTPEGRREADIIFQQTVAAIYDADGLVLMEDVLVSTFFGRPASGVNWDAFVRECVPRLEEMFDKESVETVYGFIVKRDFTLNDIYSGFTKRFTSMFGSAGAEPDPQEAP